MIEDVPVNERKKFILQSKPDNTDDTYSKTPVSSFAQNMLQKMGFQEGKPIGRNPITALMKPIEFQTRGEREGLGVNPIKTFKYIDEKPKQECLKFKEIVIINGKYKKLNAVILDVIKKQGEQDKYQVELKNSGEKVIVNVDQVVEAKDYKPNKNSRSRSRSQDKKQLQWITSGIIVKIKNKQYKNGTLYNQKISISDVTDEYTFCALSEKGEVLEDLTEKDIKVTLPKKGGKVSVVKGELKGEVGQFVEKKKNKQVLVKLDDGRVFEISKKNVCRLI